MRYIFWRVIQEQHRKVIKKNKKDNVLRRIVERKSLPKFVIVEERKRFVI